MRSGTPLELLQTNEGTGYSQVRLDNGMEGWVETQYLVDQPIARDQLKTADAALAKLQAEHQQTLSSLQEIQSQRNALSSDLKDTKAKFEQTSQQLAHVQKMSANVMEIDKRNNELKASEAQLKQQIKQLTESNRDLTGRSYQAWFVRGGALVIIAMLVGFWFARRIYMRRYSGW